VSNQPQIYWVSEALCPGIKRPGPEADHASPIPRLITNDAIPSFLLCVHDVYRDSFSFVFNMANTARKARHSPAIFDFLYANTV
jgi:hypothetical protein